MRFIFFLVSIVVMVSCSSTRGTISKQSIFSERETALILSGTKDEPMRVLQITNPKDSVILRTPSEPFAVRPGDTVLELFTDRLFRTVRDSASLGVGIAAPQVGILKKIIWVQRFDKADRPFEVYYNPIIRQYSELTQETLEGCLSIPDFRDTTKNRAYAVLLEYDNRQGQHECEMIEDFTAVIIQHEVDHLHGILFTDHLEKERKNSGKHKY